MQKKLVLFATVILTVIVCLSCFAGCDSSARNVKYLGCDDYLFETGVQITMSKRLTKVARWGSHMEAIKFKKGLPELYDLMQMQEGYEKTLMGDYVLIEKQGSDKLYSWGIFPMSAWIENYNGEYDFVLINFTCSVQTDDVDGWFFFPVYAMRRPLVNWTNAICEFNMTLDELVEFYTQHGFTTKLLDNVLTVSTPIKRGFNGYESYESWEITFQYDGAVSVGNFLTHETVYKWN